MIVVGITGSIGMGKTTIARHFADEGVPVVDADAIVHALYAGPAAPAIEAAFPGTVRDGVVDRQALAAAVLGRPEALRKLESIVHPMVRAEEVAFVERHRAEGADIVVVDIPLLFETKSEDRVDVIVVVSCDPAVQRERVLARPGMTAEKFEAILARQVPDSEKRARADFIVDTGGGLAEARDEVRHILAELRRRPKRRED